MCLRTRYDFHLMTYSGAFQPIPLHVSSSGNCDMRSNPTGGPNCCESLQSGFFSNALNLICNQICSMTSPGLQALTTNKKRFIPPEAMFHNVGNWESAISGCLMYKVKICWVDWLWGGPYYGVQLIPLVQLHNILNFLQIILT